MNFKPGRKGSILVKLIDNPFFHKNLFINKGEISQIKFWRQLIYRSLCYPYSLILSTIVSVCNHMCIQFCKCEASLKYWTQSVYSSYQILRYEKKIFIIMKIHFTFVKAKTISLR